MTSREPRVYVWVSMIASSVFFFGSCSKDSSVPDSSPNFSVISSFKATYDAETGNVTYEPASLANDSSSGTAALYSLGYENSTGVADGAIIDPTKTPGDVNYSMGLVDPDNCSADYNSTTHVLSFYSRIVNKSDYGIPFTADTTSGSPTLSNVSSTSGLGTGDRLFGTGIPDGTTISSIGVNSLTMSADATASGTTVDVTASDYIFSDPDTYPAETTFYTPFHFVITGLEWDIGSYPQLITAVNTNLQDAYCEAEDGLTLTNCDGSGIFGESSANNRFDSVYPDNPVADYVGLPGWDFTPFVTDGNLQPGEDTGCVQFLQFTLTQNQSFTIYFDLLGVKEDPAAPPTPVVTTPSTPSYANTNTIDVTINNCASGRTLYVDGGESQASSSCTGTSATATVTLNQNTTNTLSVYQVNTSTNLLQSPSTNLTILHDNVAPTVVSWSPANGEVVVGTVTRCIATFSEPMDEATFNAGTGTGGGSCNTGNLLMCNSTASTRIAGALTFSSDSTQAVYTPTSALSNSTQYTCNAKTASGAPTTLRDLAGNALSPTSSVTFTTGTAGQDLTAPYVKSIFPLDNATISPDSNFYIYFSEPVQSSTLTATDCSSGSGTNIPNIAVWQTNSCSLSGYPTPRPNIINGNITLNAEGDIATFSPTSTIETTDCLAITVGSCVRDLAGNALPSRGSFNIGAYGGETLDYNSWNIFYTAATSDSTSPSLVHVGPILDASSVHTRVFPFVVFDEPIDAATVIGDYFYLTVFGNPTKLNLTLNADPTLQTVTYRTSTTLSTSTNHVLTVTGAVSDTSGNLMAAPQTSNFTSSSSSDSTAPSVVSVTPTNGSTVSRCSVVDVYFSEPMDTGTLNGANIQLIRVGGSLVKPADIQIYDDGMHVRLIPQSSLQGSNCGGGNNNCRYRPTISTGATDRAGNALASTYNSTTFRAGTDTAAPSVSSFVPPSGSTVAANGSFAVFFSEMMDRSTLTNTNITFPSGCSSGFRSVFPSDDGRWAVVNCYHNMDAGGGRSMQVAGASVRDRYINSNNANCESNSGNTIGSDQTVNFTVGAVDSTGPTVSSVSPTDDQTSVSTSIAPQITFSEAVDPRTVIPSTIFLMDQQGNLVSANLSLNSTATAVTITPVQALSNPGIYYIVATTAVRDLGGANAYDGNGGESSSRPGILRTCFSTSSTACP